MSTKTAAKLKNKELIYHFVYLLPKSETTDPQMIMGGKYPKYLSSQHLRICDKTHVSALSDTQQDFISEQKSTHK